MPSKTKVIGDGYVSLAQAAFMLSTTEFDVQKLMDSGKLHRTRMSSGDCASVESIQRFQQLQEKARER